MLRAASDLFLFHPRAASWLKVDEAKLESKALVIYPKGTSAECYRLAMAI